MNCLESKKLDFAQNAVDMWASKAYNRLHGKGKDVFEPGSLASLSFCLYREVRHMSTMLKFRAGAGPGRWSFGPMQGIPNPRCIARNAMRNASN